MIASGQQVILRDRFPSDVDSFIYWRTHGEWRKLDAPWEVVLDHVSADKATELRERFLETCAKEPPEPRTLAAIATLDGTPLGWVNRYHAKGNPDEWYVGIGIAEGGLWDRGLGTESLWLWVDYLFANSDFRRIGLTTWSFNPRMMRVAEKVGFLYEGIQREVREWEGKFLDRVQYGMLRREWEALRQ
ncbi:MAG: GNAT family N-acetyltransferase [Candidatus Eisenbacteria sp.]|nr:GNAT family N-acetyltransferase [Candidatus Eisenbacteria bacterium]